MKTNFNRLTAVLLAMALVLTGMPGNLGNKAGVINKVKAAEVTLRNPVIETDETMITKQKVTYDCVWFGSYPQTEIVDQASTCGVYGKVWAKTTDYEENPSLYAILNSSGGWNSNGDITISGVKYRRIKKGDATCSYGSEYYYSWGAEDIYRYFRYEPIKWRVLNVDSSGSQAFLFTNKALDDQKYTKTTDVDITWKTSTLRSWLNGYGLSTNTEGIDYTHKNFVNCAFSPSERGAIESTYLDNKSSSPYSESYGGDNTTDKIFLLSSYDVYNTTASSSYGLSIPEARRYNSTTYAKAMGGSADTSSDGLGNCSWWLRSPGNGPKEAAFVFRDGGVGSFGADADANYHFATCPALNLNLLSTDLYSYAGTVCTDGTVNEIKYNSDEGPDTSSKSTTKTKPDTKPSVPTVPTVIPEKISPSNPATVASVDKKITAAKTDADPKGSVFNLLQAKGVEKSKTAVKLSWKKVSGAKAYIIYGNKCGAGNRYKKIATVTRTSFTHKKLNKGTYYKYLVVAVSGDKALSLSKTIHVATKGGKVGNCKKLKLNKAKVTLKKKKTFKLKAKEIAASKKKKIKRHRKIAFESSNPKIAKVTSAGKIKAIKKGRCKIYVYAQNGVYKTVTVKVK